MKRNRLIHGDCLEVLKKLPKSSINVVICDPPYRTTSRGTTGTMGGMFKNNKLFNKGKGGFKHNSLKIQEYLPLLHKVMKAGAHGYLMSNDKNLSNFLNQITLAGFKIFKVLIWYKNNAIASPYYMHSHEYIIFFRKGKAKYINNRGTKTVLEFPNPRNKVHPSEKPVDLMKTLILNSSRKGQTVLDFAMGSGSTGVAAAETGRIFIGIEKDKKFFKIAKDRIQKADRKYKYNKRKRNKSH
jgi:site-specific DNA-methyltransferase (adenine-specific)